MEKCNTQRSARASDICKGSACGSLIPAPLQRGDLGDLVRDKRNRCSGDLGQLEMCTYEMMKIGNCLGSICLLHFNHIYLRSTA